MPPNTGQLTILLIIIKLAESGVLGELHEGRCSVATREQISPLASLGRNDREEALGRNGKGSCACHLVLRANHLARGSLRNHGL